MGSAGVRGWRVLLPVACPMGLGLLCSLRLLVPSLHPTWKPLRFLVPCIDQTQSLFFLPRARQDNHRQVRGTKPADDDVADRDQFCPRKRAVGPQFLSRIKNAVGCTRRCAGASVCGLRIFPQLHTPRAHSGGSKPAMLGIFMPRKVASTSHQGFPGLANN